MAKHFLHGSERAKLAGSKNLGQYDLKEEIEVRLTLRRQHETELQQRVSQLELGEEITPLDRQTFARLYGTSPEDLAKVRAFAAEHGLAVVKENPAASSVVLSGTVAQLQEVFEVQLDRYEHPKGDEYRGRTGAIYIPEELQSVVTAVLGLDNRPQAHRSTRAKSQVQSPPPSTPPQQPQKALQEQLLYTPQDLAALYNFPPGDGKGQCVGILGLDNGYQESDLTSFFSAIGVAMPTVVPISMRGTSNPLAPDPKNLNTESTLDIEICGALIPGATLAVYFAKNDDAHLAEAIDFAIHDDVHRPSVFSISWGSSESLLTEQTRQAINHSLQVAALLGITVCVASGDNGSSNGSQDINNMSVDDVSFPASSPYALACGGTRLVGTAEAIEKEIVWNDVENGSGATGGGMSRFFPALPWQESLSAPRTAGNAKTLTHRGLPDVAGNASIFSGYSIFFKGGPTSAGGTSAVAPLWAALIARINSGKNKSVGFINPKLYRNPGVCRDVTEGNNGSYAAALGWNACTGLGSPDGQKIFDLL